MAEDGALAHAADGATHEVQVGAADGRCGDADHRIGAGQHLGLCDVVQAYVADIVEYHCFHDRLPLSGQMPARLDNGQPTAIGHDRARRKWRH
ncbi:hypothetical protein GMDG_08761, partial [Pseudogymnoascus destructans 20631-21]